MFEILNIKRVQQSTTTGNLKYDLELFFCDGDLEHFFKTIFGDLFLYFYYTIVSVFLNSF
jgi:hypothetical protein